MVNIEEYKIKLEVVYKSLSEGRKNKSISLKKAYDLLEEVMKEGKGLTKQETDKEFAKNAAWEEFEMIKKFSGKFAEFFTDIREEYPSVISDKLYSDLKEEVKELEDFIKQEEEHQKFPSGNGNGNDTNNNDNTGNNGNSHGKGSGGGKKPSSSNNSELEEKIKDLQNQLSTVKQELEKKQQQNPNSIDSQQEERKKDELERELERLKREKEENERRSGNQNPQKDSFPYGLIIGGGIVIFLLLIAVIFFWRRNIYPPRSLIYQKIQQITAEILRQNNYQPIIFPTFEAKELFTTSLGSTTDIIHKEMYTFLDRKERELALRPEGTASMVRLVCQNKLIREGYPLKLYYWANMFRYERPQQGRYREFWQLGAELINADGAIADYQILNLTANILRGLRIKDFSFKLNHLGNNETKERYKKKLKDFIKKTTPDLCVDCRRRNETNPLRILDCSFCKNKYQYPSYKDAWSEKDNDYISELNGILDKFNFSYQYDYHLVRGLDYYTGLVFEIDLGTEKAILGGGRYDNLYQEIGGVDVPALGFAIGIERLVDYLEEKKILKTEQTDYPIIAGVDEAGRGALAGPIIVAAVVLPTGFQNPLIQDSKILNPSQRKRAYRLVKKEALEYNIIAKSAREVETKNPLAATKEAMAETLANLKNKPDLCLVDGQEKVMVEGFKIVSVVGGDRRSINIAAASIVAKDLRQWIKENHLLDKDFTQKKDALLLKVLTESQADFLAKTYQLEYQNICEKLFQEPKNEHQNAEKVVVLLKDKESIVEKLAALFL
ncbi:2055_t:CDS:2, partial [Cetraspora pellucida]